jgi:hypothetical protein
MGPPANPDKAAFASRYPAGILEGHLAVSNIFPPPIPNRDSAPSRRIFRTQPHYNPKKTIRMEPEA